MSSCVTLSKFLKPITILIPVELLEGWNGIVYKRQKADLLLITIGLRKKSGFNFSHYIDKRCWRLVSALLLLEICDVVTIPGLFPQL